MSRRHRRRVWCETVPPATLAAPATVALLRRHAVDPIVAVWPDTVDAAREAAARFADAGLRPAIWPMLADADGRWIGAANAAVFCAFAERLAGELGAAEIVLDLEPPIEAVRQLTMGAPLGAAPSSAPKPPALASRAGGAGLLLAALHPAAYQAARARIAGLATRLRARGTAVSAAVALPILLDRPGGDAPWQERLGTPVDGIAWDHVSPMLYTSILEGWSRGLLARGDVRALLAWSCAASARRFGPLAGASLGAVGTGAFGDEPVYRSPAELADDVAVARAAGVDDLALFDLGGVLRRPPAEAWLEAFTTEPTTPPITEAAARLPALTHRARALVAALRLAGVAFDVALRVAGVSSAYRRGPGDEGFH